MLLFEGIDPARPERGSWWTTPGGGVDNGESLEAAAVREIREETGLRLAPTQLGSVVATRVAEFEFEDRRFRQTESFFATKVARFTPRNADWEDHEQRSLLRHRWWDIDELRTTHEIVYPKELADLAHGVLHGTTTHPFTLSGL